MVNTWNANTDGHFRFQARGEVIWRKNIEKLSVLIKNGIDKNKKECYILIVNY